MEFSLKDGCFVCEVNADIVASNVKQLVEEFKAKKEEVTDYREIIIDLSKTNSIDSMGITFLIALHKNYNSENLKVKLIGVSEAMMKIFQMLKLVEILNVNS